MTRSRIMIFRCQKMSEIRHQILGERIFENQGPKTGKYREHGCRKISRRHRFFGGSSVAGIQVRKIFIVSGPWFSKILSPRILSRISDIFWHLKIIIRLRVTNLSRIVFYHFRNLFLSKDKKWIATIPERIFLK